jgi:siroheme decarboxylase
MTTLPPDLDARLLVALQRGLPLVRRPFAQIGAELGLSEEQVLDAARGYFEHGKARRFGAIFDVRRVGYAMALCAAALQQDELDRVVPLLTPNARITHCYLRTSAPDLDPMPQPGPGGLLLPNLWFTVSAPGEEFDDALDQVHDAVAPAPLLVLPAVTRFKIGVIFDPLHLDRDEKVGPIAPSANAGAEWDGRPCRLTAQERAIVRALQGNIPLTATPFDDAAESTGWNRDELMALLVRWKATGLLRRVALIVHHRRLGFTANGMCVWPVAPERIRAAGRALASRPEVTHCYQRPAPAAFPFSLYAMIHTGAWDDTRALFRAISRELELPGGLVFCSVREYKKTSHALFS